MDGPVRSTISTPKGKDWTKADVIAKTPEIPSSIKIGPINYKVDLSYKGVHKKVRESEAYGLVGHIDFTEETITLDPSLSHENQAVNIFHECLHALVQQSAILREGTDEESIVTALSFGITQLMLDNPDLAKWLYNGAS